MGLSNVVGVFLVLVKFAGEGNSLGYDIQDMHSVKYLYHLVY
jgi:hypothetical protein